MQRLEHEDNNIPTERVFNIRTKNTVCNSHSGLAEGE